MARGFKVADIYAELTVDKDRLRESMRGLGNELGPDADRAGRDLGDRLTSGVAGRVEQLSDKVVRARQAEQRAADGVQLAETRLNEARDRGNQKASTMLGLEQRLAQAQDRLAQAQQNTARSTDQINNAVQSLSDKVTQARDAESKAAEQVRAAETRLNEARRAGVSEGSNMFELERGLAQSRDAESKATEASKAAETRLNEARRSGLADGPKLQELERGLAQAQDTQARAAEQVRAAESRVNEGRRAGISDGAKLFELEKGLAQAQDTQSKAAESVRAAETRLNDARRSGSADGAKLFELEKGLTQARDAESRAAQNTTTAQVRLNEARRSASADGAKLLELERGLTQSQERLSTVQETAARSTTHLDEANRSLARSMEEVGRRIEPEASKAGTNAGDKMAEGMKLSLGRHGPLIIAVAAGVLAAGAPLMSIAATALFAGIGIVAAAQSEQVKKAWRETWESVSKGAQAEARVIEPVLIGIATRTTAAFNEMRPALGQAFTALAPQIKVISDGIIGLAQNAMPGLVRSLQAGMPVSQAFAGFLSGMGTGLSQFFTIIAQHSPAAATAFTALGQIINGLLPILGELVGQGAELAAVVLPPLASAVGVLADVLSRLGPLLPLVGAGLLAWKVAAVITPMLGGLAAKVGEVAASGGVFAGVAGKMSGAMGGLAAAAGPVAAAVGFSATALVAWNDVATKAEQMHLRLGQAMHVGGDQARAAGEIFSQGAKWTSWVPDFVKNISVAGTSLGDLIPSAKNSSKAFDEWKASLGASGFATEEVRMRTEALDVAVRKHGAGSKEATAAGRDLTQALDQQKTAQGALELATEGVTGAMLEQGRQALALVSSQFAYEDSLDGLEDKQKALADAVGQFGTGSEQAGDATRDFAKALFQTAGSAGEMRAGMSGLEKGTLQYNRVVQTETLAELYRLRDAFPQMREPIQNMITQLEHAGISLSDLGKFHAEPKVGVDTSQVDFKLPQIWTQLNNIGAAKPTPTAFLNAVPLFSGLGDAINRTFGLANQRPTPTAFLNGVPLFSGLGDAINRTATLGQQRPTPTAFLNGVPLFSGLGDAINRTFALGNQRPTPTAFLNGAPLFSGLGDAINRTFALANQRPTPTAFLNGAPLFSGLGDAINRTFALANQRPTPTAFLNGAPLFAGLGDAINRTFALANQRPTPTAFLNAAPLFGGLGDAINRTIQLGNQRPTPTAFLNSAPLFGGLGDAINRTIQLGNQRPTPVAGLNTAPFSGGFNGIWGQLNQLAGRSANPSAGLNTAPFSGGFNWMWGALNEMAGRSINPTAHLQPDVSYANAMMDWAARTRYSQVIQQIQQIPLMGGVRAGGGSIGSMPIRQLVQGYATGGNPGGKLRGPGTTTSDSIGPFSTSRGFAAFLSDQEWIIKALSASRYGDRRMAAVNAGTATVLLPGERPGDAIGRAAGGTIRAEDGSSVRAGFYDKLGEGLVRKPDGSIGWAPGYGPNGKKPGFVQAEDGSWVPPSFFRGAAKVMAEDRSTVAPGFYDKLGAGIVRQADGSLTRAASAAPAAQTAQTARTATQQAAARPSTTVNVQHLDVHLRGFDIRDRVEVKRFGRELRRVLIELDREQS